MTMMYCSVPSHIGYTGFNVDTNADTHTDANVKHVQNAYCGLNIDNNYLH